MNLAHKYNPLYTLQDYLQWEGRWELLEGLAIAMTPSPSAEHQQAGMALANVFYSQLQQAACQDCFVYYELDWIVDTHTVVRPDLMIVCGEKVTGFLERPPTLVVEILSPATREKDRNAKWALYQNAGVPFYLIVDPKTHETDVYRLIDQRYQMFPPQADGWTFDLHDNCSVTLKA